MSFGKMENDRYFAQCRKCGEWQEVRPQDSKSEPYFAHWEASFSCCGLEQRAIFIIEKDELDFH